jgi:hypothetical protein
MRFWQIFAKIEVFTYIFVKIFFCGYYCNKICKTGENARSSFKKLAVLYILKLFWRKYKSFSIFQKRKIHFCFKPNPSAPDLAPSPRRRGRRSARFSMQQQSWMTSSSSLTLLRRRQKATLRFRYVCTE